VACRPCWNIGKSSLQYSLEVCALRSAASAHAGRLQSARRPSKPVVAEPEGQVTPRLSDRCVVAQS
jgi:hypothetical protein